MRKISSKDIAFRKSRETSRWEKKRKKKGKEKKYHKSNATIDFHKRINFGDPVAAVCVNNNWYTAWQRISIKSGLFSAAFVRSYEFQERLHSLNWMSYNHSFTCLNLQGRRPDSFLGYTRLVWYARLLVVREKYRWCVTENCHPRLSSRLIRNGYF